MPGFESEEKFNNSLADEERLCNIISKIKDCGEVSAMVTYSEPEKYGDEKGRALGAIIVYSGSENSEVEIKISEAVQAALDLPPHKVKVYKSE